jgi:hypothetical protein
MEIVCFVVWGWLWDCSKVKWDLKERPYDWHKIMFNPIEHPNKIRT